MKKSKADLLRRFIERGAQVLTDQEALEAVELHEEWEPGIE